MQIAEELRTPPEIIPGYTPSLDEILLILWLTNGVSSLVREQQPQQIFTSQEQQPFSYFEGEKGVLFDHRGLQTETIASIVLNCACTLWEYPRDRCSHITCTIYIGLM